MLIIIKNVIKNRSSNTIVGAEGGQSQQTLQYVFFYKV